MTTLAPYIGDDPNLADGSEKPKSVAPGLTKLLLKFAEPFAGDKVYVPKPAKMTAIAPLHGPVVRSARNELVREYRQWVDAQVRSADDFSVAVIYASAYGNTSAMAQAIARGITKAGVAVEMLNCELSTNEELEALIEKKESMWDEARKQVAERLDEMAEAFTGTKALSRVGKDDQLQSWFSQLSAQVKALDSADSNASARVASLTKALRMLVHVLLITKVPREKAAPTRTWLRSGRLFR